MDMSATVTTAPAGSRLSFTCAYEAAVPYFEWAFAGPVRASVRGMLAHRCKTVEASTTGAEAPPPPKRPWWSPPDSLNSDQIRVIATLSVLLAIIEYGGSLLTQTVDYVATTYEA